MAKIDTKIEIAQDKENSIAYSCTFWKSYGQWVLHCNTNVWVIVIIDMLIQLKYVFDLVQRTLTRLQLTEEVVGKKWVRIKVCQKQFFSDQFETLGEFFLVWITYTLKCQ